MGSPADAGNAKTVREGHNLVLEALGGASQAGEILAHTRYLNGHVLFPYRPLADAVRMTTRNYKPGLGTPLYDQTAVLLGTVLAKAWEFEDNGLMRLRIASINDLPISESQRLYHWPLGHRPDGHQCLSELGL